MGAFLLPLHGKKDNSLFHVGLKDLVVGQPGDQLKNNVLEINFRF